MPRISKLTPAEAKHGAQHVAMLLEQIEKRYAADMYSPNMAAAYVLYLIKKAGLIDVEDLSVFLKEQKCDRQLAEWIKMHIDEHWMDFRRLIAMLPVEWLQEYLLTHQPTTARESETGTPECLCDLVIGLMEGIQGGRVLDPCCGIGNFMVHLVGNNVQCSFAGYDLSDRCVCVSKIRANVMGIDAEIRNGNTLEGEAAVLGNFSKIFIEPPLGQRLSHIHMFFNTQEGALPPAFPMVKSTNSTEWIWAAKMLDALADDGRIIIIVSNGALYNMTETPLRQYLVDRGYIESVIALPEKMLNYSGVNLSIVVISKKRCNGFIKMIDASNLYERGARVNVMKPLHISAVIDAIKEPASIRRDISTDEIIKNNYQLSVQRYFMPEIKVHNGRPLIELCHVITRGVALTREELHEKRMDVNSGVRCLTVSDVQDGVICDTMPFINGITVSQRKYLVESGDVVLTKAMAPYKVAVAEVKEGTEILATANFFILKVDRTKINPYFLMAYLRSETGKMQMEQIATGTTIRTIVQDSLEKMLIPMVPLRTQELFAEEYRLKLEKLSIMRQEYDQLKCELDNGYDNFNKEVQE